MRTFSSDYQKDRTPVSPDDSININNQRQRVLAVERWYAPMVAFS